MLTVTRIAPGAGVDYLVRQVATGRHDFRLAGPADVVAYHADPAAHGEAPGWWAGASTLLFGVRGEVTEKQIRALIGAGQHPETGKQLGRMWRRFPVMDDAARQKAVEEAWDALPDDATYEQIAHAWLRIWTAPERHPVAGFDVTVSPVKSVSLLWAFGDDRTKHAVMAAHHEGVRATLDHLRQHGAFTRLGANGLIQVDTDGVAAMVFDHRMSRAQDPQIHSHIIVSAKVRIRRADGSVDWLSLDSKAFYQASIGARIAYERAVEHELGRRLGVTFAARPGSTIREIVGIHGRSLKHYSKRRTAIETEMDTRLTDPTTGREQIPIGRWRHRAQDATLRTRQPKDAAESTNEAVRRWQREDRQNGLDTANQVRNVLAGRARNAVDRDAQRVIRSAQQRAGRAAVNVAGLHDAALHLGINDPDQRQLVIDAAVRRLPHLAVERAIADLSSERAVFGIDHLELAIGRVLHIEPGTSRTADWARVQQLAVRAVRDRAGGLRVLTPPELMQWGPSLLRGSDRQSVYSRHRDLRFSTEPVLNAEKELLAYAVRTDAVAAPREVLDRVAAAQDLSDEKCAALLFAVGDTRSVTGIVGPAGTGKTFLQRAVGIAAHEAGIPVLGLTVGQNAAYVLAAATREGGQKGIRTENIAMWLHAQAMPPDGDHGAWSFRPGQWVIVDEASQASTLDLIALARLLKEVGGKLILVGDPEQVSAIGPGGMFRYLASLGTTTELRDVRRFTEAWEGPASLRLRAGDTTILAEYDRRGRILSGDRERLSAQILDGWAADILQGRDSLILVETEAEAATFAAQARQILIHAGLVQPDLSVELHDGNHASVGDLIVTRRNNRTLTAGDTFVANRAVWRIQQITDDGGVFAKSTTTDAAVTLPGGYMAEHVQLAYAATVDSAQGRTVDVARALIDEATDRARLYVMATRGALLNLLAVVTDEHPDEVHHDWPTTSGTTVLAAILRADTADRSATETEQTLWADVDALHRLGPIYDDLAAHAAAPAYIAVIDRVRGPVIASRLATAPALPALVTRLQLLAAAGYDPQQALASVASDRELYSADDVAAVLVHRIENAYGHVQPDPLVALSPAQSGTYTQRAPQADGDIGDALRRIAELCDTRIEALAELAADRQPAWTSALGPVPDDEPGRRQWISRVAVVAAYRDRYQHTSDDPIGTEPAPRDLLRWQAWQRAQTVLGVATLTGQLRTATDTDLRELIGLQRAADRQAPEYVAGKLRVAHTSLVAAEQHLRDTRLNLATARAGARQAADAAPKTPRWWEIGPLQARAASRQHTADVTALRAVSTVDELTHQLADARVRVNAARQTVDGLETKHHTWTGWYTGALPTRYAGLAAAAETARRAQRLAADAKQLAGAVNETTARVHAADATRPKPHEHAMPDRVAEDATATYKRVTDPHDPDITNSPSDPEIDHA